MVANGGQIAAEMMREAADDLYRLAAGDYEEGHARLEDLAKRALFALDHAPGADDFPLDAWVEVKRAAMALEEFPDPDRAIVFIRVLGQAYLVARKGAE